MGREAILRFRSRPSLADSHSASGQSEPAAYLSLLARGARESFERKAFAKRPPSRRTKNSAGLPADENQQDQRPAHERVVLRVFRNEPAARCTISRAAGSSTRCPRVGCGSLSVRSPASRRGLPRIAVSGGRSPRDRDARAARGTYRRTRSGHVRPARIEAEDTPIWNSTG